MCSDHFAPWSRRQGHSGFTWSWLGAAMQATPLSFGTVCAPGQRYHPAIIAQAAATLAEMFDGRFWLAVGSGEALNESITGTRWPPKSERNTRLKDCVDVMRALWKGEAVTIDGLISVARARLHVHPAQPPLIVGAALSPETARWMGGWADALVTVAGPRDGMRRVIDAFREGGGEGKPMFLQVAVSYADSDGASDRFAMDQWRQAALEPAQLAELDSVEAFDRATESVTLEALTRSVRSSADIHQQMAWLQEDAAMGFSRLYLHNVARDHQERFIDACGTHLLPSLTGVAAG